jgi:uncharacterized membrane protein/transposase-like protein
VRLVRETGHSIAQVARELGVSARTLRNWVNTEHRPHGDGNGGPGGAGVEKLARMREGVPALATAPDVRVSRAPMMPLDVMESQAPTVPLDVVESPAPAVPSDGVESPAPAVPSDGVESPAPPLPADLVESPARATAADVKSDRAALHRVVALAPGGAGAYIGALALIAVLVPLHGFWAAQVLLVPLLLIVPGAILLRALRIPRGAVSAFPVYVPCASLIVLLGSGLVVDLIGPLVAVAAPIRAGPLLVGLEVVCLALLAKSGNAPSSVAIPWRSFARPARLAWPLILPLVAVAGALRLNSGHGNGVAVIATAACVVVLVTAIVLAPRLDKSLLAVILYAAGLALMWSISLRGALVPGFDIATEYYKLHQTVLTGIWHPAHHYDAYGAMLSVTVMPAELHFLSGVPDLLVFQVVYPAIGALLPVAVFGLARRVLSHRWAFAAATFVVAQAFSGLPMIARQEIATVLFAALFAAMLDARIQRRSQWALVALLGLAMAASHYSTTYVAITLIGLMLPLQWVVSWFRKVPRVTGAVAVAFVVALAGAFIWYGPVTHFNYGLGPLLHTIGTRGFDVLPNRGRGESLLSAYLHGNTGPPISARQYARLVHASYALHRPYITPLPDAGLPRYALHNAAPPTPPVRWRAGNSALSAVYLILQQLANLLGAIGALLMVLRRRSSVTAWQVGLLAFAAVLMLAVMKLSATVADFYNWERALLQAQVVLAIALCWPLQFLDDRWALRLRGRPRRHRDGVLAAAVASFTVILICTSGLANVALGGGALGGGTNINLANSGEAFNRYYLTAPELASAGWLGKAARPGQLVYADRYAQLRLFAITGSTLNLIGDVTPLTLNQHAWVYADRTNVLNHSAEVLFNNSAVTYIFPAGFLDANYDLVYTNGSSEVFRR